jgi:hypothetical protein
LPTWARHRTPAPAAGPRFGVRGLVPIGYAAFAFALGLTAGLLFRRLLPAMLAALAGFAAAREAVTAWVRPYLFTLLHLSLPITTATTPVSIDQTSPGVIEAFESVRGISLPDAGPSSDGHPGCLDRPRGQC